MAIVCQLRCLLRFLIGMLCGLRRGVLMVAILISALCRTSWIGCARRYILIRDATAGRRQWHESLIWVARRAAPCFLQLDGALSQLPPPGAELFSADGRVGSVLCCANHFEDGPIALGLVKRAAPLGQLSVSWRAGDEEFSFTGFATPDCGFFWGFLARAGER